MANKREFKKALEFIGSSALEPMMAAYEKANEDNKNKIGEAVNKIIDAIAAARSNADITFDKGVKAFENLKEYSVAKKNFYKKLFQKINDDFTKELEEALKEFNATVPDDVKEENKNKVKA